MSTRFNETRLKELIKVIKWLLFPQWESLPVGNSTDRSKINGIRRPIFYSFALDVIFGQKKH